MIPQRNLNRDHQRQFQSRVNLYKNEKRNQFEYEDL